MKVSYVCSVQRVELGSSMFSVNRTTWICQVLIKCYSWQYINTLGGIGVGMFCNMAEERTTLLSMADGMTNCDVLYQGVVDAITTPTDVKPHIVTCADTVSRCAWWNNHTVTMTDGMAIFGVWADVLPRYCRCYTNMLLSWVWKM